MGLDGVLTSDDVSLEERTELLAGDLLRAMDVEFGNPNREPLSRTVERSRQELGEHLRVLAATREVRRRLNAREPSRDELEEQNRELRSEVKRLRESISAEARARRDDLLKNVPPQDMEAERAVLGAGLLDGAAIKMMAQLLEPEDFYRHGHGLVFKAMRSLHKRGAPVDPVTLTAELRRVGQLDEAGGVVELATLTGQVPSAANAPYYAKLVREASICRRAITVLATAQREIFEGRGRLGLEPFVAQVEDRVFELVRLVWPNAKRRAELEVEIERKNGTPAPIAPPD